MSQLKVNSIIPVAGVPTGGGGGIVQVVQKIKTSAWAASIGSSGTVPTGMYQTITTKTDSSKVLIFVNMTLLIDNSYNGSAFDLLRNSGTDNITGGTQIFIGDADGIPSDIKDKSNLLLSLSPLTFPHELARLILIEQIYRAISISNNSPYHRD